MSSPAHAMFRDAVYDALKQWNAGRDDCRYHYGALDARDSTLMDAALDAYITSFGRQSGFGSFRDACYAALRTKPTPGCVRIGVLGAQESALFDALILAIPAFL